MQNNLGNVYAGTAQLLRIYYIFIVGVCFANSLQAQQLPAAFNVQDANAVFEWTPTSPQSGGIPGQLSLRELKWATQYIDGLGRPVETVIKKGSLVTDPANPTSSANAVDLVTAVVFDPFGRESNKYLSFAANNTGGNTRISDGAFKSNPFEQQQYFYSDANTASPIKGQGETFYYGKTEFEASPLNRPLKSMAAGNAWVNAGRGVSQNYWINTVTDAVRVWTVAETLSEGQLEAYSSGAAYGEGQLYKNATTDEHGKQVIEFKDKEGRVVLKKVQLTATADNGAGSGHTGWLCTYYVYDNLGSLRCVIQPEGVKTLETAGWNFAQIPPTGGVGGSTLLAEQCFRYEYDARRRMIVKKVPGADPVYMVYDARDRLVMTQDGNLRIPANNKWLVTLYDELNRPVQTGLLLNTLSNLTFAQHLAAAAIAINYPFSSNSTPAATYWEYLTKTGYDDYTTIPAASGLTAALDNTNISATYGFFTTYNASPDYAQPVVASAQTKGMATWSEVKVLGTSTYLYSVTIVDEFTRPIQTKSKNITGGIDIATTQYSWAGQPLIMVQKQVQAVAPAQTTVTVTKMTYDDLGRVLQTDKKVQNTNINSNALPATYTTISKNEYDALGQLKTKKLGTKPATSSPLETLTYDYNIRGWLLGANRSFTNPSTTATAGTSGWFGFDLGYDKTTNSSTRAYAAAQYNGNIEGMVWRSVGDGVSRKYDFSYDVANRLMKGQFEQRNADASWNNSLVNYNVLMGDGVNATSAYDANGNILRMQQWGLKVNSSVQIDDLKYTYKTNSNRLQNVIDPNPYNDPATKLGDFRTAATHPQYATKQTVGTAPSSITDYDYDVNGNLRFDNNKAISAITYNHLNLPATITVTGKGTIAYTYDAAGTKLRKVTSETGVTIGGTTNITLTTTTTYIGGMVYESKSYSTVPSGYASYSNQLQFAGHEEGRTRAVRTNPQDNPTSLVYDYFLKDHLGNVRMVLTDEQQTIIYPASTFEGDIWNLTANSMVNHEKKFFTVSDLNKIINEDNVPGFNSSSGNDYQNHNGNPPTNTNYPAACVPDQNTISRRLYKLNAASNKSDLQFMIKVMAGDKIDIFGKSYYVNASSVSSSPIDFLSILAGMVAAPGSAAGAKGITGTQLNTWNTGLIPSTFIRGGGVSVQPKAYINYMFFDEQFKYCGGNASPVGSSGSVTSHWNTDPNLQNIAAPKNGYIFVYASNESNVDVFFDNIQVIHKPGPLLEETHYYPFGLTMVGISSKAAGSLANKKQYAGNELQNKEFSDGSGLEFYDFNARTYDQQTGRFLQADTMSEKRNWLSVYNYSQNNPISRQDPGGKFDNYYMDEQGNLLAVNRTDAITDDFYEVNGNGSKVTFVEERSKAEPTGPSAWNRMPDNAKVAVVHNFIKEKFANHGDAKTDGNGLVNGGATEKFVQSQNKLPSPNRIIGAYNTGNGVVTVSANPAISPLNPQGANPAVVNTMPNLPTPKGTYSQSAALLPKSLPPNLLGSLEPSIKVTDANGNLIPLGNRVTP